MEYLGAGYGKVCDTALNETCDSLNYEIVPKPAIVAKERRSAEGLA